MTDQPLVSIIIPTFNRAHLIGETLDSVLAQTYINWECIVVDDGSTDATSDLMKQYCEKDSRFHYHHRPNDRLPGGNAARNYGFEVSKGEYINWFDSDDVFKTYAIEKKVESIFSLETICDYNLCGFETFGSNKNDLIIYPNYDFRDIAKYFVEQKIIFNTQATFFSRRIVKDFRFNESLSRAQDLDFVFRVLKQENLLGSNIADALIKIRIHKQSITHNFKYTKLKDVLSELQVWKQIYDYLIKSSDRKNSDIALAKCLEIIRKILIKKRLYLFLVQLNSLSLPSFILKAKLNLMGITYYFFNRGQYSYTNEVKLYFENNS